MPEAAVENLEDPGLYLNRELSLLAFQRRVLALAEAPETPLLERLRFLTICSSNLDEFFEIRVAGLHQQRAYGIAQAGPDGLSPTEQLQRIAAEAHEIVDRQYRVLNEVLQPALEEEGVRISRRQAWTPAQRAWARAYFENEVQPVLTPLALDPAHPFPRILNKSLNFIVGLEGEDAFGRESGLAVVQVPRALPRVLRMPEEVAEFDYDFAMLSSIVHAFVDEIFPGMTVTGCYQFRVTRNSDLWVDEEEVEDLLHALQGELQSRKFGDAVRLEVARGCPRGLTDLLLANFELGEEDLYEVDGPVNLHRLEALYEAVERPDLKFPPFRPGVPPGLGHEVPLFDALRRRDVLLHHPYQSFAPVVEMVRQAARDPRVLAIQQTLYRTGGQSALVDLLVEAALAGKEVTAVVELRARFDEAANIQLATRLQEAGAKVVYGIVGYKTHCKMLLVVRREEDGIRRYVHLGTGNYHLGTTRAYTDFGLMSADPELGEDVHRVFRQLTSMGRAPELGRLLHSPFTLQARLLEAIEAEIEEAHAGRPAWIRARMNSLSDPRMIRALYRASQAGVRVDLLVRGICCLRPGLPGVSENIRVRSLLGRFLEHSRAWWFHAAGRGETWLSSADWMPRNLYKRVELAFPVEDPELRRRVLAEALELPWEDNTGTWELQADGSWRRRCPGPGEEPRSAQRELLERWALT